MKKEMGMSLDHSRNQRVVRQVDYACLAWRGELGGKSGGGDLVLGHEDAPSGVQLFAVENCGRAEKERVGVSGGSREQNSSRATEGKCFHAVDLTRRPGGDVVWAGE